MWVWRDGKPTWIADRVFYFLVRLIYSGSPIALWRRTIDSAERVVLGQKLLIETRRTVEEYFNCRAVTDVLCKLYNVTNYWFRYESQHRGSCHVHGMIWLFHASNPKNFDAFSAGQICNSKHYYDYLVSAFNPSSSVPPALHTHYVFDQSILRLAINAVYLN